MHPIVTLFEREGLTSEPLIQETLFRKWSIPKIEQFAVDLYNAINSGGQQAIDAGEPTPFTFVSSLSLSGAAGCAAPPCRVRNAQILARYAALYADKVFAPVPLINPHTQKRPGDSNGEFGVRLSMTGTALSIHEMRPAIEAGMVEVITPQLHFCRNCIAKALGGRRRIVSAAHRLANEIRPSFSMSYRGPNPLPVFTVHGPVEYCDHGQFVRFYFKPPSWLPKAYKTEADSPIPAAILKKSRIVDDLFQSIAFQVALQEFLSFRYGARTLTTNPGELSFLAQLDPAAGFQRNRATSLARLTHLIPLMNDIPLARAIRIRREESDAFLVYRKALNEVIQEQMKRADVISEEEAAELIGDVLEPEIAKLRQLAASELKKAETKARTRLLFAGTLLTLGLFRGLLPTEYAALGSAAAVSGLVDSLAELRANPSVVRNNNFYFLLRLTQ
jgi:hypothetical protein